MIIFVSVFCGLYGLWLAYFFLRGGYRLIQVARSGDRARLKKISWAELRIGLTCASCCLIAATHGQAYNVALLVLIGNLITRLPADWRMLMGQKA